MRSNKKGFTLIELLAVIVILAIIALIATPIVLNIISKARVSAAKDTVYGMMNTVEYVYFESMLDDKPLSLPLVVTCDTNSCTYKRTNDAGTEETIPVLSKGTQPTGGTFELQGVDSTTGSYANTGKFKETAADSILVGNIKCTIKADQSVTCK